MVPMKRAPDSSGDVRPSKSLCIQQQKHQQTCSVDASHAADGQIQIKVKLASPCEAFRAYGDEQKPRKRQVESMHDSFTIEYSDPKYARYDEFADLNWLEPVDVVAIDRQTSVQIGHCLAQFVEKSTIANEFHDCIRQPFNEVTMLGFDLFDCHGGLREDYRRKISEYWESMLNAETILLIEDIIIDHPYQGRGIDTQLLKALLRATQQKLKDTFLAITWPASDKATRFCETFEILVGSNGTARVPDPVDPKLTTCFRALGFRPIESSIWFGLAVRTSEAFDRPRTLDHYFDPLPRLRPRQELSGAILAASGGFTDAHMLQSLEEQYGHLAPDSEQWWATDIWGNTILHLAAQLHYSKCVGWILEHGSRHLPRVRNMNRDTPLQALELVLEKYRSRRLNLPSYSIILETFSGYPDDAVWCLAKLRGIHLEYNDEDWKRLAGGCSCGLCIEGYLSPCMSFKLSQEALFVDECLKGGLRQGLRHWTLAIFSQYDIFPDSSLRMVKRSPSSARGCMNMFKHIIRCLRDGSPPSQVNVMRVHDRDSDERDQVHTKHFFMCGGSVLNMLRSIFVRTRAEDTSYMDDSIDMWCEPENWPLLMSDLQLPECRNDFDYRYVSRMCGFPIGLRKALSR